MKVGVISDLHANIHALRVVLVGHAVNWVTRFSHARLHPESCQRSSSTGTALRDGGYGP
jgi:hypothetical protein